MAIHRALLLIADIGGYTRFMSVHRVNLAHAQDVVARLLESILDAAGPLKLAKLEGDAAFLYAKVKDGEPLPDLYGQVAEIRRAFLRRQAQLEENRLCSCDGCVQATQLKLKFVAHVGEVAEQRVKRNQELAGVAVITVHRLLKNGVELPEYMLMTDELQTQLPRPPHTQPMPQSEHLEGLGETRTWYVDLSCFPAEAPAAAARSHGKCVLAWMGMVFRSIPYFVRLKEPCEDFHNLGEIGGRFSAPSGSAPPSLPQGD